MDVQPNTNQLPQNLDTPHLLTRSDETKIYLVIIFLVLLYPVGFILMWIYAKWPLWVKLILSLQMTILGIAILLGIVLIAISPSKQIAQTDNIKRNADIHAILNAIEQYARDNNGAYPLTAPGTIGSQGVDICYLLVPKYVASLPVDPLINNGAPITNCIAPQNPGYTPYNTGYTIALDTHSFAFDHKIHVIVSAPKGELNQSISATQ